MELPEEILYCKQILQEALEKVEKGEVIEVLVLTRNIDETMGYKCSQTENIYNFIGYFEQFKVDILTKKEVV